MPPIEKASFEATVREIRKVYGRHSNGEINSSTFAGQTRRLVNQLKRDHVRKLVAATATQTIAELESYQKQFGLDLSFKHDLYYERGVKACISLMDKDEFRVWSEVFIGPKFQWNLICIQPTDEYHGFSGPNMYTKRMSKHWKQIEDFDFPAICIHLRYILMRSLPANAKKTNVLQGVNRDALTKFLSKYSRIRLFFFTYQKLLYYPYARYCRYPIAARHYA